MYKQASHAADKLTIDVTMCMAMNKRTRASAAHRHRTLAGYTKAERERRPGPTSSLGASWTSSVATCSSLIEDIKVYYLPGRESCDIASAGASAASRCVAGVRVCFYLAVSRIGGGGPTSQCVLLQTTSKRATLTKFTGRPCSSSGVCPLKHISHLVSVHASFIRYPQCLATHMAGPVTIIM